MKPHPRPNNQPFGNFGCQAHACVGMGSNVGCRRPLDGHRKHHQRRGGMYILALGTSMVVTVVGVSALLAVRIENRFSGGAVDFEEARFYARSAIEIGSWIMGNDTTWRTSKTKGFWKLDQPLGRGTFSLHADDPVDGDLADSAGDPVLLTGIGKVGPTTYQLSVQMTPYGPPGMDCLASAIHGASVVDLAKNTTASAPISSNSTMSIGLSAVVNANVEAVSTISNSGTILGTVTTPIAAKEMPAATVFDYYISQAVEIPFSALSLGEIDRELISPTSNPYGPTSHPQGLYLIRCGGAKITIQESRILGTLVVLDPGSGSAIAGAVNWERFDPALPAMMVRGPMEFEWSGTLQESGSGRNMNFNPSGSPYQGGSDSDESDTYPARIRGLVYVSGDFKVSSIAPETIDGVVICGGASLLVNQNVTVIHDAGLLNAPPPGFERRYRPMKPTRGTWKQSVD